MSTPINSNSKADLDLQIALRTNEGVLYYQTVYSIESLFSEKGAVDQATWLDLWRRDISEFKGSLAILNIHVAEIAARLASRNVFLVAERRVENCDWFYGSVSLEDGTIFIFEIQIDAQQSVKITCKSEISYLLEPFNDSLLCILTI